MDLRTREAIRYLGYGKNKVDEKTFDLIKESFQELEMIADKSKPAIFFGGFILYFKYS